MIFLGGYAERRGHILARCAPYLEGRRSVIKLTESDQPHTAESRHFWSRRHKWEALAGTELMLNVHRSAVPYLEWHRMLGRRSTVA